MNADKDKARFTTETQRAQRKRTPIGPRMNTDGKGERQSPMAEPIFTLGKGQKGG
jgi:hypothetical protein